MISPINKKPILDPSWEELNTQGAKSAPQWLDATRHEGISRFKQLGFPTLKDEEWRYTDVSSITGKKFKFAQKSEISHMAEFKSYLEGSDIVITFVNGLFSKKHSKLDDLPKNVSIVNLADSKTKNSPEIQALLSTYASKKEDAFAALNCALLQDGIVIDIADKTVCDKLIHIIHFSGDTENDFITLPRTLVSLGKSSEATILESYISFSSNTYFANALTDVFLKENANLRYFKAQGESPNAFHIGTIRAHQESNSQFETFSFSTGAKLTRNNLTITLNGEGAAATLNGLYAAGGDQHVDNHTTVEHLPPNCTSNQLYKGILDGNAKAVFNGKIFVHQEAQKTNSYQLNKNLMLGSGCQINTKPQLEIFADDVRCTHGATIGQLNEDEMFYLLSRAIPKTLAVKMLCRGFVDDVLNKISNPVVRQKMDKLLTKAFSALQ